MGSRNFKFAFEKFDVGNSILKLDNSTSKVEDFYPSVNECTFKVNCHLLEYKEVPIEFYYDHWTLKKIPIEEIEKLKAANTLVARLKRGRLRHFKGVIKARKVNENLKIFLEFNEENPYGGFYSICIQENSYFSELNTIYLYQTYICFHSDDNYVHSVGKKSREYELINLVSLDNKEFKEYYYGNDYDDLEDYEEVLISYYDKVIPIEFIVAVKKDKNNKTPLLYIVNKENLSYNKKETEDKTDFVFNFSNKDFKIKK